MELKTCVWTELSAFPRAAIAFPVKLPHPQFLLKASSSSSSSSSPSSSSSSSASVKKGNRRNIKESNGNKISSSTIVKAKESHSIQEKKKINLPSEKKNLPSEEKKKKNPLQSKRDLPLQKFGVGPGVNIVSPPKISISSTRIASIRPDIQLENSQAVMQTINKGNDSSRSRPSKRARKCSEELQHILKLNMCSKHGDLHGALEVYDIAKQGVFDLKQQHYNMLLYICSGAASGSLTRRKGSKNDKTSINKEKKGQEGKEEELNEDVEAINFSPCDMDLAAKKGVEIYEDMIHSNVPSNEATFTSIARLAVANGDGDMAFETVKKMAAANIAPKLRSYEPPLLCFCNNNQVEKAFQVDDHMIASGVLPDENLLQALLEVSVEAGLEDRVYSILHRLRTTVRDLQPATVGIIEKWFNSKPSAFAGKENQPSEEDIKEAAIAGGGGWHGLGWLGIGKWKAKRTNISKKGVCLSCGEKLCTIDLDPNETEKFAKCVADLAFQKEKNTNGFKAFQEWLDANEPIEAIIDGANIGLYNSMFQGFNFNQVSTVADAVKAKSPTRRPPLIVLHCRRTSDKAQIPSRSRQIVNNWVANKSLYSTPYGSNDDWYWLYAAVRCKSLLVTNDEMRDHIFELLGNDFFPKWKERHQVRFTFSTNGLELFMPPPYSTAIQESASGAWHIPQNGGDDIESPREWLCVTRSSVDTYCEPKTTLQEDLYTTREEHREIHAASVKFAKQSKFLISETSLKLQVAEELADSSINFEI